MINAQAKKDNFIYDLIGVTISHKLDAYTIKLILEPEKHEKRYEIFLEDHRGQTEFIKMNLNALIATYLKYMNFEHI